MDNLHPSDLIIAIFFNMLAEQIEIYIDFSAIIKQVISLPTHLE